MQPLALCFCYDFRVASVARQIPDSLLQRLQGLTHSSSSVRRLGVSCGLKMSLLYGLHPYTGVWILYTQSNHIPPSALLFLLYFPTLVAATIHDVIQTQQRDDNLVAVSHNRAIISSSNGHTPQEAQHEYVTTNTAVLWRSLAVEWMRSKHAGLGMSVGLYASQGRVGLGCNAICDIFPFYVPLRDVVYSAITAAPRALTHMLGFVQSLAEEKVLLLARLAKTASPCA